MPLSPSSKELLVPTLTPEKQLSDLFVKSSCTALAISKILKNGESQPSWTLHGNLMFNYMCTLESSPTFSSHPGYLLF